MTSKKVSEKPVYAGNKDRRIIEKKLRDGELKPADLKTYWDKLPDLLDQSLESNIPPPEIKGPC